MPLQLTADARRELLETRLAVSVDEACGLLGVGRVLVFDLIGSGRLHSVKAGARRLIPIDALRDFLAGPSDA